MEPTRKDYMDGKVTFAEYYRAVNKTAGLVLTDAAFLERCRQALAAGDEHLNTIPLAEWDRKALPASPAIGRALKAHGDHYSMSGGVCCMKQAARDAL